MKKEKQGFSFFSSLYVDCRQLKTLNKTGLSMAFQYDANGQRVKKTVNGAATTYWRDTDGKIVRMQKGSDVLLFMYEGDGRRVGFLLNGVGYYYVYNAQGDVVGLIDKNGTQVVSYVYDAWGRAVSVTGSSAATAGALNPFRYRGYEYDTESGLYYLLSRYYDPMTMRFVNADNQVSTGSDMTGMNLFAYCGNNPINRCDPSGKAWTLAGITYDYDGSLYDFRRAEQGLPPISYENALKFARSLPKTGEPGSSQTLPNPDGTPKQKRWYGPDGNPERDRDYNHPGNMPFPHDHEWKDGKRQPDHLPPDPSYNFSLERVVGIGLVTICVVGIVAVAVDDVTGIGVADDVLFGPLGAGVGEGLIMIFG